MPERITVFFDKDDNEVLLKSDAVRADVYTVDDDGFIVEQQQLFFPEKTNRRFHEIKIRE